MKDIDIYTDSKYVLNLIAKREEYMIKNLNLETKNISNTKE